MNVKRFIFKRLKFKINKFSYNTFVLILLLFLFFCFFIIDNVSCNLLDNLNGKLFFFYSFELSSMADELG
jgi:hypothetical protein